MSNGVGSLLEGSDNVNCRCGHGFDRHPAVDKFGNTLAWDCVDCKCPIYEDPDSEVYCFCQLSRQDDGSKNICY